LTLEIESNVEYGKECCVTVSDQRHVP